VCRPEYVDLGAYQLVVESSRVWAFRLQAAARDFLEMKPEQRLDTPHVNLFFESAARDLVSNARFLEPAKRQRLEQTHGAWPWVQHVVEVITGRRTFVEERRPPIDLRPREEPPPYVLPEPLDPGGPIKLRDTFIYEVRLVDELGEPIEDVLLRVVDSDPMRTDADGRIRYDDGSSSNSLARFPDPKGLREALRPRWEQIREGDWITEDAEHTYIDAADPLPMVRVRSDRLQIIVVQPRVICARILELLFDTNKSFLLPSALEHIREVRKLYDTRPRAEVLIVGHTDITGEPNVNDPLSLNRAKAVKAYLRDDVETWLDFYGDHMHPKARWGADEDHLMLQAVLAESGEELTDTPVRHFQATRGLEPDNKLGDNTRRAIITEYMAVDGTTLPEGIDPIAHGCGENFPLDPPEDGEPDHSRDRRVELFFFDADLGILPPPQGDNSGPGTPEYPEWRRRSVETHQFAVHVLAFSLIDDDDQPVVGERYEIGIDDAPIADGRLDAHGRASLNVSAAGDYWVRFPALVDDSWNEDGAEALSPETVEDRPYIVQPKESLEMLLHRERGVLDPTPTLQAEQNALMADIRTPDLRPGDQIHLPTKKSRGTVRAPLLHGEQTCFRVRGRARVLRLSLREKGEVLAGADYLLTVCGMKLAGTTDDEGRMRECIPSDAREADLEVNGVRRRLIFGGVDPLHTVTGVQARLSNLGFHLGAVDGITGPLTRRAIRRFQTFASIRVDGMVGATTREALEKLYRGSDA
jgi:outer membrane protein OmpA-like peptidoglycan-associated protein